MKCFFSSFPSISARSESSIQSMCVRAFARAHGAKLPSNWTGNIVFALPNRTYQRDWIACGFNFLLNCLLGQCAAHEICFCYKTTADRSPCCVGVNNLLAPIWNALTQATFRLIECIWYTHQTTMVGRVVDLVSFQSFESWINRVWVSNDWWRRPSQTNDTFSGCAELMNCE